MSFLHRSEASKLRYEFLPAAEEIVESPSSPFGRSVLWITIALLGAMLLWLYFGTIDVIATATGKVVPDGSVKSIQSAVGGTIIAIDVTEGQPVTKGQKLIELDTNLAQSAVDTAKQQLAVAKLERDIVKQIDAGLDPTDSIANADVSQAIKDDMFDLARSKRSAVDIRKQLLSVDISQAQSTVTAEQQTFTTIAANLQKAQDSVATLTAQLTTAMSSLQQAQLQAQLTTANDQVTNLQSSLGAQQQRIAQAQLGVTAANTNLQNYSADTRSTDLSSIINQDKTIATLTDNLAKAQKALEQQTLVSPVDGTVLAIATKTVGGVATPAQALITIVPTNAKLYVEANISTNDIGFVKSGQKVVIKVDTYSFQRYGYLNGTIETIGADAVQSDDKKSMVYKARVQIDTLKTNKDTAIQLMPGMTVTDEVVTGHRRIIEFFLDPLITHVDGSLKIR